MLSKTIKIILFLLISNSVIADSYLENSNLSKFVGELDFLIKRIDDIERVVQNTSKTKFHYSLLKRDLKLIKTGINDHIKKTLNASKNIEPLNAHYHESTQ